MKTVYLSDEGFAQIDAALEARASELQEVIDLIEARYGQGSDKAQDERDRLDQLNKAALEFHGVSTWRSGVRRSLPKGSSFS